MLGVCELLASAVFQKIEIRHLCNALTMVRPFGPIFVVKKQKCLMIYRISKEVLEPFKLLALIAFEIFKKSFRVGRGGGDHRR